MIQRVIDLISFGVMLWLMKICVLENLTPKITSESTTTVVICATIMLTCVSLIIVFRKK